LLTDADIFVSMFFDRNRALTITRRLKLECRIEGQPESILDGFVHHILKGKLSSPQGEILIKKLRRQRHLSRLLWLD
jgi:hypothetical protein